MRLSIMRGFVSLALGLALAACGETRSGNAPTLSIDPGSFRFARQAVDETSSSDVRLSNVGQGDLIIRSITLQDTSTDEEFQLQVRASDGTLSDVPESVTLAEGEQIVLSVIYTTTDEDLRPDTGSVVLETNDAARLSAEIPIEGDDSGAEIVVTPTSINFEDVTAGDVAEKMLSVANIGEGVLLVSGMGLSGSTDFSVLLDGEPVRDDLDETPFEIAGGESIEFLVRYAPEATGPDGAELLIASNDALQPATAVDLTANGEAACIRVVPTSVDFQASLIVASNDTAEPTPNKRSFAIESCGGTPLVINSMEITGADAGAFHIAEMFDGTGEAGSPLFILPALVEGEPPPSRTVALEFRPTDEIVYGARLLLHTNSNPDVTEVVLFGRGVVNECPIPASTTESFDVAPLDIVTLDGTPSTDPGGTVVQWLWSVVDRPDGSVAKLVETFDDLGRPADGGPDDDPETPAAKFFVDVAGEYEFELAVVDDLGQRSCLPTETVRVRLSAVPDKDLHIQLVWTTPDDPDETDMTGTDVDLHLQHPMSDGGWNTDAGIYDCYFANKSPDWGVQLDPLDNPSLDIDDVNGAGPENINLARPEPLTYELAALYFRAESPLGGSDPTEEHTTLASMRLYVRGELLGEWLDRELVHRADLWHVASIRWCDDFAVCPEVISVDQVLSEAEYDRP